MYIYQERVYRMAKSATGLLCEAQREAEQMVHQDLADDLLEVCLKLRAIVKAAEQKRYRSPSPLSL